MRFIRYLIAVLILILLILIFIAGSIYVLINPNKLTPALIQEVKQRSGYTLNIDTPLSLTIYPSIGVSIPHMTLAAEAGGTPFLILHNTKIVMQFSSLWRDSQKFNGDIYVENAQYELIKAQKLYGKLNFQDGILSIYEIQGKFYHGDIKASVIVSNLKSAPKWTWQAMLKHAETQSLINDLTGGQSQLKLAGDSNAIFQGTATGRDRLNLLHSIQGSLSLFINQGIIYGVDLSYLLQSAKALIDKTLITNSNTGQTYFKILQGSATITRGIIQTDDLKLTSTNFSARARGSFNLLNETLDFQVGIQPDEAKQGMQIPVHIQGEIKRPAIGLDMDEVSKMLAKIELERARNRIEEEINKGLPGDTSEFLRNLIGR